MPDIPLDPYYIDHISRLPGTVIFYNRHMIVCSGHSDWAPKIQDDGGFVKALGRAFAQEAGQNVLKLTACDLPRMGAGETVLIFPDRVRISGLTEEKISDLFHYVRYGENKGLAIEPFKRQLILVCTHEKRDVRCGLAAPDIIQKMKAILEQKKLSSQVIVAGSSHLGGHKFAGVVVVYPSGNWYGRLTDQDAIHIIEAECVNKLPYLDLWRGKMGLSPQEQIRMVKDGGWSVLD